MAYKTHGFSDTNQMDFFLNGGVVGGVDVLKILRKGAAAGGLRLFGLDGLTIILTGGTATFSDANDEGLTLVAIKAVIDAVTGNVVAEWRNGKLLLSDPGGVTTVDKDGTANSVFGFSKDSDSVGTPVNPPDGAAPRIITIEAGPHADAFYVTVEEA